jgi:heavy metal sensor kinase
VSTPRTLRVRTRLTLWYVATLAAVLVLYTVISGAIDYWQVTRQIYHDQIQDMETVEGLLYFTPDGRLSLNEDYHTSLADRRRVDRYMEVLDQAGAVLFRNDRTASLDLGGPVQPGEGRAFDQRHMDLPNGEPVQLISHLHAVNGRLTLIRLAYSLTPVYAGLLRLLVIVALVLPLTLIAAAFAGGNLVRHALDPLASMAAQTERITAHRLHERLSVDNPDDEFGQIARVLNDLLSRLAASFDQLGQFSSNVAHELRTPLAAIRSVGEVGLQHPRTPEAYREIIGSMLEETSRLTELIDGLLMMSRAEPGRAEITTSVFPLIDLIREATALVEILAHEKRASIDIDRHTDDVVRADRMLVRLAIVNVLHNAIKHSPVGGRIVVRVSPTDANHTIRLSIEDQGPGIPERDRERIFERFVRVDSNRSRDTGGIGLGLALARWAVSRSHGTIRFDAPEQSGALCVIELPGSASAT